MLNGSRLKGLLKYNSLLGGDFPVEVQCLSTCNIEIEEEEFLALWEYTHVTETDESPGEDSDFDEPVESTLEEQDLENENMIHCLPFKVMGVTYNKRYQDHLEAAKAVGAASVAAKIEAEPHNQFDSNAIAVFIDYGNGWVKIRYIVRELTRYIHPLLVSGKIVSVDVKHVNFCIVYLRVGYYVTINITRSGLWEEQVLRASHKVK